MAPQGMAERRGGAYEAKSPQQTRCRMEIASKGRRQRLRERPSLSSTERLAHAQRKWQSPKRANGSMDIDMEALDRSTAPTNAQPVAYLLALASHPGARLLVEERRSSLRRRRTTSSERRRLFWQFALKL